MEKLKRICKNSVAYIASRRLLRYSIIFILILLPVSSILITKYLESKDKNIEIVQQQSSKSKNTKQDVATGKIKTDVIASEYSRHTLNDGYSMLSDEEILNEDNSANSHASNTISNTSQNIDKSSISGINLEILEGYEFNPRKDLKLKATDKNGSNISDNIIIEKNTVNTTVPGVYSVKASIKLSNGQIKEKEFTVTVKETRLDVSLKSFKASKQIINKNENIGFEIDLKVSKNHVSPIAVMINGKEYPLYKGNENLIDVLTSNKNYKAFINADSNAGIYDYNLEYVKMSNGAWISLGQNTTSVEVLKTEAAIKNFNYEEKSIDKKIEIKFDLEDLDNTSSNLRLEFYKDNNILETIKLDKKNSYSMELPVNSNGIYNLKILSDINLNQNIDNNTTINKEIFNTTIKLSNINETSITGNNIEIIKGDKFDFIKDLDLKATDVHGEDITNKIQIEGNNIDVNKEGKQSIVVSIINKNGSKYTKEFTVDVIPVTKVESNLFRILPKQSIENKAKNIYKRSNSTINGNTSDTLRHTVDMTGIVSKSDGSIPNGKIQVELPTVMSFTVDQSGIFKAGNYIINNKSSVGIKVSVSAFKESNPNGGISVKPINENIVNLDRSNLHLALVGDNDRYVDLGKSISTPQDILYVEPSSSNIIQLLGESGKGTSTNIDQKGISEDFTLIFQIKKN